MRVMDGSEPGEDTPAAVLSGAPIELQARTVRCVLGTSPYNHAHIANNVFYSASTNPPKPQRNPATGTLTTGVWIGTLSVRVTDGKTL